MIKFKTESGSYYEVDLEAKTCRKNGGTTQSYTVMLATPDWEEAYQWTDFKTHEWVSKNGERRIPAIGECLYLASFEAWSLSSPVVKIESDER